MNRTSAISAGIAAAFAVALFCMLPAHPAAGQQVWKPADSLRTVSTLPDSDAPAADGSTSAPSADGSDGSTSAPDTEVCMVKLDSALLGHSIFDRLSL